MMDGVVEEIIAPAVFKSGVNVRKVLYIREDMRWATLHPTDETDLLELEQLLITKSDTWQKHASDLLALNALVNSERKELMEETA
jgi:hypothetical protein